MTCNGLAPHEMMEVRELLSTKVTGIKKLKASMPIVKDEELMCFMKKSSTSKMKSIISTQDLISKYTGIE